MLPWRGTEGAKAAAATVKVCGGPELATCMPVAEGIRLGAEAADVTARICGGPELATCMLVVEGIGFTGGPCCW